MPAQQPARLIVAISGSSAPQLGAAFLAALRRRGDVESHLVLSAGARRSIELEMRVDPAEVERLADVAYDASDIDAPLASRSFPAMGMAIIPCSMRTLAAVAGGDSDNLVSRAAGVTLTERRRLGPGDQGDAAQLHPPTEHGGRDGGGCYRAAAHSRIPGGSPGHRRPAIQLVRESPGPVFASA